MIDKYIASSYRQYMYDRVIERVNELGWQLDDAAINDLVEKEINIYNETIQKEFKEYLESYLLDKYGTDDVVQ